MNREHGARVAIDRMGGVTSAARALTLAFGDDISRHPVGKWLTRGVARQWLWRVAALSGVSPHILDPVVYPPGTALPDLEEETAKLVLTNIAGIGPVSDEMVSHLKRVAGEQVEKADTVG